MGSMRIAMERSMRRRRAAPAAVVGGAVRQRGGASALRVAGSIPANRAFQRRRIAAAMGLMRTAMERSMRISLSG